MTNENPIDSSVIFSIPIFFVLWALVPQHIEYKEKIVAICEIWSVPFNVD